MAEAWGDAGLIERMAKLNYRFLDAIRHRDAFSAAGKPATARDFQGMQDRHYALVVTFKRSGEAVPSPVLFALEDGKVVSDRRGRRQGEADAP